MIAFAKGYRPEQEPEGTVCLFVGGSHDGKHLELRDTTRTVELAVPKRLAVDRAFSRADIMSAQAFSKEVYTPQQWRAGDNQRIIYVIDGMSSEDMLDALIGGYRPMKSELLEKVT